jgi:ribosomal protein L37AE/L43A
LRKRGVPSYFPAAGILLMTFKQPRNTAILLHSSAGKYYSFSCPVCESAALFKITAGSGWCDDCKSVFIAVFDPDGEDSTEIQQLDTGKILMTVEIQQG